MADKYTVPFLTGYGDGQILLEVDYFAGGFLRNNGVCAFCLGDPCNEDHPGSESNIDMFYKSHSQAESCPMCEGRPS